MKFVISGSLCASERVARDSTDLVESIGHGHVRISGSWRFQVDAWRVERLARCSSLQLGFRDYRSVHRERELDHPTSFDSGTNWPQCVKVIGGKDDHCGCCWLLTGVEAADRMRSTSNAALHLSLSLSGCVRLCVARRMQWWPHRYALGLNQVARCGDGRTVPGLWILRLRFLLRRLTPTSPRLHGF